MEKKDIGAVISQKGSRNKITSNFQKKYRKIFKGTGNFKRLVWTPFSNIAREALDCCKWVLNVRSDNRKPSSLSSSEYVVLIHLASQSPRVLMLFNKWIWSEKTKLVLLPFSKSYQEAGFIPYTPTKTKYKSCWNVEPGIQLKLSAVSKNCAKHCNHMFQIKCSYYYSSH